MRYVSHKPDQAPLRLRVHDLAAARVRYGYNRLRREGWLVDHKSVGWLYGKWAENPALTSLSQR